MSVLKWRTKKILKIFRKFQFLTKNFQFLGSMTLYNSCHNLAELWPGTKKIFTKIFPRDPSKSVLQANIWKSQSFRRFWKKYHGVKITSPIPIGVYVDQKTLVFPELTHGELNDWATKLIFCLKVVVFPLPFSGCLLCLKFDTFGSKNHHFGQMFEKIRTTYHLIWLAAK